MNKLFTFLFAILLLGALSLAQTGAGSKEPDNNRDTTRGTKATKNAGSNKKATTGKKGHKGGKKGKKGGTTDPVGTPK